MLQGGRLGGGLAGGAGLLGVAGALLLLLPGYATLATGLWSAGAFLLAVAAWAILVRDERPPVRVGGWVALAGLLVMGASGAALASGQPQPFPLFPLGALAVIAGLGSAGHALTRAERTRTAGGWVLVSALALLLGLVLAASPIGELGLAVFFGAWIPVGFLATHPEA